MVRVLPRLDLPGLVLQVPVGVILLGERGPPPGLRDRLGPRPREQGAEVAPEDVLVESRQALAVAREVSGYEPLGEATRLLRRPGVRGAGEGYDGEDGVLAEVGGVALRECLQDLEAEWCYLPASLRDLLVFQVFLVCCTRVSDAATQVNTPEYQHTLVLAWVTC